MSFIKANVFSLPLLQGLGGRLQSDDVSSSGSVPLPLERQDIEKYENQRLSSQADSDDLGMLWNFPARTITSEN